MNLYLRIIISIYILFTVYACAVVSSPTGGPKDEIPPRFGASDPFDGQTNVDTTKLKITLYFDEYVQEEKLKQNLIITPYKADFKYKTKFVRNKVVMNILDTLEQNTTYFMDFGKAVVDVTEKNPAKNVRFAFSTGDYLDSLEVTGQVFDLMTNEPIEGGIIALYDPYDSLDVNTDPPLYYSRTVKDGLFILERFKPGFYKVYAIADANEDYKYTLREEKVGFFSDSISLDKNIDGVKLYVRDYDLVDLKLNRIKKEKEDLHISFNKGIVEYGVDFPETNTYTDSIFSMEEKGEIKLIYTGLRDQEDSLRITGYGIDSLDTKLEFDTLIMFPSKKELLAEEKRQERKKSGGLIGGALKSVGNALGAEEEEVEITRISFEQLLPKDNDIKENDSLDIVLRFPIPLKEWNMDSMMYVYSEDTVMLDSVLESRGKALSFNFDKTEVTIPGFVADSAFAVILKQNSFVSVKTDSTKQKTLNFSIKEPDKYGIIEGLVKGSHDNFTVQLLDGKNEPVMEIENERKFSFEYVKPGTYKIRVLIDENGDGVWFPGDFKNRIPPEPTAFFPKEIKVEANWEIRREDTVIDTDKR
ncbi:Ig-like domain-containing protein [Flammeovirga sp. SubArs3]|uniref:Ig-like domain-containing protein n=1 Tax=Flammeovirga sp. SubArs3 TaxID=2995316 RepID=UPI00248CF942|nr:Ig-like domain-containing protein [Flammeovirga sp. SubArs3]